MKGNLASGLNDAFPLGLVHLEVGMGDEEVPDDGLEGFAVRSDVGGVDGRDDDAGVGDFGCVTAVFADDGDDVGADLLGELEGEHEIRGNVFLEVAAADGQDQQRIDGLETGAAEPFDEDGGPALVVGAGGEFGDVGGGGVALEAGDFPEIVYRVRGIGGAAADVEVDLPRQQVRVDGAADVVVRRVAVARVEAAWLVVRRLDVALCFFSLGLFLFGLD